MGSDAIFTKDPSGNLMVGEPVQPKAAYPAQTMPSPEYFQPPRAFYGSQGGVPPQVTGNPPPMQAPSAPPPPYYYGAPAGGVAPYNPYGDAVTCVPSAPPTGAPLEPTTTYQPSQEITADFSRNEHTCTSAAAATGNPSATHLNFHDNRLRSLGGLERFPNLLRLTVSWNDLQSLQGLERAPYLRWVDGSGNHLVDFTGMGNLPALEWLNLTQGDMTSFRGLGFAPNLTWLCLHHNRFNDFRGVEKVPALQFLDVSDNEVRAVTGLERATALREINLCNNPMCEGDVKSNVASVKKLAALPHLVRLNINDTFYDKEEEDIVAYFRTHAPKCEVITTPERTAQVGHNYKFKGQDCLVGGKPASGSKKKCRKCCIHAAQQPAGALLNDLRHQQATIAAEMDAMKIELDRALSQQPSAAAAAARSPSPIHRRPVSGRAPSRNDPVFADPLTRGHVAGDVWQQQQPQPPAAAATADDYPPHPSLASASRLSCGGETDGGGYYGGGGAPDAAYLPASWRGASARDHHQPSSSPGWNISTAVPPYTPHKKRQRTSADRPQPLFTHTRPKSRGFYELNSKRSATASPGPTAAPLPASVRLGELKEKYGTPAAPSKASGQGAGEGRRVRGGGGGRPTNVRSRSPDMDLTIRPARYFDEEMNKGGAAVPAAGTAPCGAQAPLRGECRPVATQLGLWATMPHSTKQVAKQLGFTRER